MSAPLPFQVDIPQSHALAQRMASDKFGNSDIISIPRLGGGLRGNCYRNAQFRAKNEGGKIVFGWAITMWPRRYIEALHHAAVVRPDGTIVDVTAAPFPACQRTQTTFMVDLKQDYSMDLDPHVPSAFIILDNRFETAAFIKTTIERTEAAKAHGDILLRNNIKIGGDGNAFRTAPQVDPDFMQRQQRSGQNFLRLDAEKNRLVQIMRQQEPQFAGGENQPCPCGSGLKRKNCHALFGFL